jgi:hypothetical protein
MSDSLSLSGDDIFAYNVNVPVIRQVVGTSDLMHQVIFLPRLCCICQKILLS